jgi:AcrR family transcriptional regulator
MDRKAVQEDRIRSYFITAAKELIRAEGIAVVSARNVAERAGYSYATLYNYFKDIRDLIFSCAEDFMNECREFVEENAGHTAAGADRIKAISESYAKFFIQYPGIFELLFFQKPSDIATKRSDLENITKLFDSLVESDWKVFQSEEGGGEEEKADARKIHKLALHGLLMFCLNRRTTVDYKRLMEEIARLTDYLLQ